MSSVRWTWVCVVLLPCVCRAAPLPQEHEYQRVLRDWLGGLTPEDFAVDPQPFVAPPTEFTDAQKYRLWILQQSYGSPDVAGIAIPPEQSTLASIESADQVLVPDVSSVWLAWLSSWEFSGNPYRGSRPVKLRALVPTLVDLVMHDQLHEDGDGAANRSDYLGGTLIWLAYNYRETRDALPEQVRAAYETGLKKLILRLHQWGPTGLMTDMDLFAAVSLRYATDVFPDDPEVQRIAQEYSRALFTDERFYHPAGYFVDNGCFDVSYNGISLFFCSWAATISDWPFVHEALRRGYRLRSHLTFPEPGGGQFGPSHMSSRTSGDSPGDQWGFTHRHVAAAMATDEALYMAPFPEPEALERAPSRLLQKLNSQLDRREPPAMKPWREHHWTSVPNFAYLHFRDDFYERLLRLHAEGSSLLKLPVERGDRFTEDFDSTFLVARFPTFAAAIHTGPVSGGHREWKRPYGFGGGALSAFWTPRTGSIVLGRRRGIQGRTWDSFEEWRSWPTHAVSGLTAGGGIFSSARIRHPAARYKVGKARSEVKVSGAMPRENIAQGQVLQGKIDYSRRFRLGARGLAVTSTVTSDGRDRLAELYEVIPVFCSPSARRDDVAPARILFRVAARWVDASAELQERVSAIRVERFGQSALISFARPQRVKLSPEDWVDGYMSQVVCRNVLIDLLGPEASGKPLRRASAAWRIAPLSREQ
ncbi:MAG: hypothetical protein ACE5JM_03920 [Armatimonadota bacterium]